MSDSVGRIRIKVCGLTRAEDIDAAVTAGADALGFVFYAPSPRYITPSQAEVLLADVAPFVTTVGLFVNPSPDWVWEVIDQVPLDLLQFHGDETGRFCSQFRRPYIKAVRVKAPEEALQADEPCPVFEEVIADHSDARGFLLDAYHPKQYGGTGESFDWEQSPHLRSAALNKPMILAGGLHAENVQEAIRLTQPYAVDVSSGVEGEQKGVKDIDKLQQFIDAATLA